MKSIDLKTKRFNVPEAKSDVILAMNPHRSISRLGRCIMAASLDREKCNNLLLQNFQSIKDAEELEV